MIDQVEADERERALARLRNEKRRGGETVRILPPCGLCVNA